MIAKVQMYGDEAGPFLPLKSQAHDANWESRPNTSDIEAVARELRGLLDKHSELVNDMVVIVGSGLVWGELHAALRVADELKILLDRQGEGRFSLRVIASPPDVEPVRDE